MLNSYLRIIILKLLFEKLDCEFSQAKLKAIIGSKSKQADRKKYINVLKVKIRKKFWTKIGSSIKYDNNIYI